MIRLKPGDKVCYNPDYFEESKSELIVKCGIGEITSEEYTDARPPLRFRPHPRLHPRQDPHFRFINIKWESTKEMCWEYVDCLCLVEERKKRDIYELFEQEMNNT